MDLRAVDGLQLFAELCVFIAANRVMQFEGHLAQAQFLQLGDHRGDTDATGNEQVQAGLLDQREQIDRWRDLDQVALADTVMQRHRTTATAFHPAHGNLIAAGVIG
ncbi:hypothetical protein D3C72_1608670 [compost metagenome]